METDKKSPDAVVPSAPKLDDLKQEINSRVGFTSEEFKIEINGLPRFFGVSDAKKLFARNELSYHKMKPCGKGATYMFVNFKNEEDREKAIAVLDGQKGEYLKSLNVFLCIVSCYEYQLHTCLFCSKSSILLFHSISISLTALF